jgi:hypothetical protein
MKWGVEINTLSSNRRLLEDVLAALSVSIVEDSGELLLESEYFDVLSTSAEVHACASRIRSITDEVKRHSSDIDCAFSIGAVVERTPGGVSRHHFLTVSSAVHIHCAGHVTVIRGEPAKQPTDEERARQEQELQERRYADLRQKALSRVVSAVRDDRALTIQQLLQEELTPQILGHIVDIIQDDMNGDLSGLMSRNQQSRFYRSINHPEVFGQKARHIVSSHEPPPHPMNLAEASAFVRDVAEKWLLQKAGVASNRKSNGRDKV